MPEMRKGGGIRVEALAACAGCGARRRFQAVTRDRAGADKVSDGLNRWLGRAGWRWWFDEGKPDWLLCDGCVAKAQEAGDGKGESA